ncbi:MAG: polyphosphate kinase 1 [Oscillospiraceae bacterium]|nr:polyphosphate kinase 1 [Oscillospiraceae bacterium]
MKFIERELSWLDFNARVLAEAQKKDSPPLERLMFLAISASNLDEFFMVRVAYLVDESKNRTDRDQTGMTPQEKLDKVLQKAYNFQMRQVECLDEILAKLAEKKIKICAIEDLSDSQKEFARDLFYDEILPVLTPLAVDPARPFPFLLNQSLNIGVRMRDDAGENLYAVVQVPSILPRFIMIPVKTGRLFLPIERLIAHYLPEICNLHEIAAYGYFRITRSADFDADDDTDDLMEEMKRTIKRRRRGSPVRLQLSAGFDGELYNFLKKMLGVNKKFVVQASKILSMASLSKIASMEDLSHLRAKPILPVPAAEFLECDDIFARVRERDLMLHHPYESFNPVLDFIKAASVDPNVLAIKQTLYRVSGKSEVISALEQAAESGKQVTVLVELKARFDEENNIQWATRLERAGCHVIYGLTGLKTHCKITLVVRREPDGIRRYLHLSTGNYNDVTARLYTDIGMFTCRAMFGADASALFNHLTGFSRPPEYNKLIVAPENMKRFFLNKIDGEIKNAKKNLPSGISFKANSLLDYTVAQKLYEASKAGVPVKLLIRGICSLLPGVKGYSENIRVRSILGQFLEHSRIYAFENAGEPQVYLGSADLMPRNLDRRVEQLFPVDEPDLRERVLGILDLAWRDNVGAWELGPDSIYRKVEQKGARICSQRELSKLAALAYEQKKKELEHI